MSEKEHTKRRERTRFGEQKHDDPCETREEGEERGMATYIGREGRCAGRTRPADRRYASIPRIHLCVSNQFFPPLVGLVLIYDTTSPMDT